MDESINQINGLTQLSMYFSLMNRKNVTKHPGAIPQARGRLDGRAWAAIERRPRLVRPPRTVPVDGGGLGPWNEISRARRATARAVRLDHTGRFGRTS